MSPRPYPWVREDLPGGFNAHNTRVAFRRPVSDGRGVGRRHEISAAETLLWQECTNPPTTAEWLARLRRAGETQRYGRWVRGEFRWHRRVRPFICPAVGGWSYGYTWRKLP